MFRSALARHTAIPLLYVLIALVTIIGGIPASQASRNPPDAVAHVSVALPLPPYVAPLEQPESLFHPTAAGLQCLTDNLYFEARGESHDGQLYVAAVTLNRLRSGRYPINSVAIPSLCNIVYDPHQFSWTDEVGRNPPINRQSEEYQKLRQVALEAIATPDLVDQDVYFYYSHCVMGPDYNRKLRKGEFQIGCHTFYRFARVASPSTNRALASRL